MNLLFFRHSADFPLLIRLNLCCNLQRRNAFPTVSMCARRTAFHFDGNDRICSLGRSFTWKPPVAQSAIFLRACSAPLNLVLPPAFIGAKTRTAGHSFLWDMRFAANTKTINRRHGTVLTFAVTHGWEVISTSWRSRSGGRLRKKCLRPLVITALPPLRLRARGGLPSSASVSLSTSAPVLSSLLGLLLSSHA
jgi:hypothetical protein